MVTKFISGKSMVGTLNYNEHKVQNGKAALIYAEGFLKDTAQLTYTDKLKHLQYLISKNYRVVTNSVHISLNFDKDDLIDNEKLSKIADYYMSHIGFGNQPYLVYRHFDAAHPHIHIVSTNIQYDGSRISLHNIGKNQSEAARKEIEQLFGLIQAEGKGKSQKEFIHPIDVQKALYGKSETKRSISNVVRSITKTYKYTSLTELNSVLALFNVNAFRGERGSPMYENKGVVYSLIDNAGQRVGVPIKSSNIHGKPTLSFLEKQFSLNAVLRKPHKATLRNTIDATLKDGRLKSREDLEKALLAKGIHACFRVNSEGRVYGLTLIDHHSRCVFKGSELGKTYSAMGLLTRMGQNQQAEKPFRPGYSEASQDQKYEKTSMQSITKDANNLLENILNPEAQGYLSPEAAMQLNKKKRKRKGRSI